jgi:hypothetical protein
MAHSFRNRKNASTGSFWFFAQTKWAKWMGKRTENLSRRTLILLLLLFITLTGSHSIFLIRKSVSGNPANPVSATGVKIPKHVTKSRRVVPQQDITVNNDVFQRITQFREYMDSLARSQDGKAMYDSIVTNRPGLLDSIKLVEKIYRPQIKK